MRLLFPTIIHEFTVPTFKQVENDLIKLIYQEKKKDPVGVTISNDGGWQSKKMQDPNLISDLIINEVISYFIKNKIFKKGVLLKLNGLWANINKRGDYNILHNHPNCDLSGVFWIKIPKDSGRIEFISPNSHNRHNELESYTRELKDNIMADPARWIPPTPGQILIFPSCLLHRVRKSNSNQDRISVSFNINLGYSA